MLTRITCTISIVVGDLEIDPQAAYRSLQREALDLSPREFDLLFLLATQPEKVLSHGGVIGPGLGRGVRRSAAGGLRPHPLVASKTGNGSRSSQTDPDRHEAWGISLCHKQVPVMPYVPFPSKPPYLQSYFAGPDHHPSDGRGDGVFSGNAPAASNGL